MQFPDDEIKINYVDADVNNDSELNPLLNHQTEELRVG